MRRLRDKNGKTLDEFLSSYSPKDYPKPSVTADIVLLWKKDNYKILLIKRGGHPFLDYWALPGGFAEMGETLDATAYRELMEETCLESIEFEELGVFSKPNRDPRGWTITSAYFSVVQGDELSPKASDDAREAEWFNIDINNSENQVKLTLSNRTESFDIILLKKYRKGITKDIITFIEKENEGLAFDHSEIIGTALARLGVIK